MARKGNSLSVQRDIEADHQVHPVRYHHAATTTIHPDATRAPIAARPRMTNPNTFQFTATGQFANMSPVLRREVRADP